jgi:hypothetical protein
MQSSDHGVGPSTRRHRSERAPRASVVTHRALFQGEKERRCDLCDREIVGDDGGAGLYVWTRGEVVRYEDAPLCPSCGPKVALSAVRRWEEEEEEGD